MSTDVQKPTTPVKPVPASLIRLKIVARAARLLSYFTGGLAAFFIVFAGILTTFELNQPTLNPLIPPLTDLGLFFFGFFAAAVVFNKMTGVTSVKRSAEQPNTVTTETEKK